MADVHDGDHVAAHVWGGPGTPGLLFRALAERGVKDLTLYCNNFLPSPPGFKELGLPDNSATILLPQIKKLVTAFVGTRAIRGLGQEDFLEKWTKSGQLEVESTTHGVFIERLHAGAMGLGGFYSPIGVNTTIEKGKEKRTIDGREYILEKPIRPDVGLVKAFKADRLGNLIYHGTARGANPIIAMASRLTIVEVSELVEVGELDPELIVTPGIYVDRIVRIPRDDAASATRRQEIMERVFGNPEIRELVFAARQGGQQ
jgi:acetate CoA/acetoacetate CoA-transferase alpha subunit